MKVGRIPTEDLIGKDIPNRGNGLSERKGDVAAQTTSGRGETRLERYIGAGGRGP